MRTTSSPMNSHWFALHGKTIIFHKKTQKKLCKGPDLVWVVEKVFALRAKHFHLAWAFPRSTEHCPRLVRRLADTQLVFLRMKNHNLTVRRQVYLGMSRVKNRYLDVMCHMLPSHLYVGETVGAYSTPNPLSSRWKLQVHVQFHWLKLAFWLSLPWKVINS